MYSKSSSQSRFVTARFLQARYGDVCDRTIDRWVEAGVLPKPTYIRNRRYWDLDQIEQLERDRMAKALKTLEAA
jgi:hypothetical protein